MYYKKTKNLKNGKVRFCLNIDIRKQMVKKEDSWLNGLNAIKTKIAFVKDQLNFSSKSTTAASVRLMESLLDDRITVDILPLQCACICFFFPEF